MLDAGEVSVAVIVATQTAFRLAKGEAVGLGVIVDGSDGKVAAVGSSYLMQIVAQINRDLMAVHGISPSGPGLDPTIRVMFNPSLKLVNTMIPGLIAVIMMISLMAIMSQAVVRERDRGTLEQMFVTPITRGEYLIGKVTPYAMLALVQMAVVAGVGGLWFQVPTNGSVLVLLTGLALFMLTCIGLGLLVSVVSTTRQQAIQTTMFIMIPVILLSGFIFPIESMPGWVVPVTYAIPLRFVLEVVRGVMVKGSGFADLAMPLWVLFGFATVIFSVALLATRRRLEA